MMERPMHVAAVAAGIACVVTVLFDAFQTIILPRRAAGRFRLTRLFYLATWGPWAFFAARLRKPRLRETAFSYYGPLSLLLLLAVWAGGLLVGFGLFYYGIGSPFRDSVEPSRFLSDLYVSGTTMFTLGIGDVTPQDEWARALVILESGAGLGLLALVIGYFPVLYSAFSRREVSISLLDARAGSPPTAAELMRRHSYEGAEQALLLLLTEWERWSAELLESHISYPQLCYFRSQHSRQSWLSALTSILDATALLIAGVEGHEARQAQLTFAMARHAVVDLSQILSLTPLRDAPDRLQPERFSQLYEVLCQSGIKVCRDGRSLERLRQIRALYEGHAEALAAYLRMPLPPWVGDPALKDDWLTVAHLRAQIDSAGERAAAGEAQRGGPVLSEHHHDF